MLIKRIKKQPNIRRKILCVHVWLIHVLQDFKMLPDVWYQCEIDLAKMEAEDYAKYFGDSNADN